MPSFNYYLERNKVHFYVNGEYCSTLICTNTEESIKAKQRLENAEDVAGCWSVLNEKLGDRSF